MMSHSFIADFGSPEGGAAGLGLIALVVAALIATIHFLPFFWHRKPCETSRFIESLIYWVPTSLGMVVSMKIFGGAYPFAPSQYLFWVLVMAFFGDCALHALLPSTEGDWVPGPALRNAAMASEGKMLHFPLPPTIAGSTPVASATLPAKAAA